jgi:hypothetical protein
MGGAMKAACRLTVVVAGLMLAQAALGVTFRAQYRDVEWIAATWRGNDWATLTIALPLLATSLWLTRRGSPRALLLWLGMLGYAIYNFAYYVFGAALNAFFPLYLAALITASLTLILALSVISPGEIAQRFNVYTPVRLIGGYFVSVGVTLASIWLAMWAAYVFAGRPTPVEPEAFKLVAALDTVLMVPALAGGGLLLWRRNPWGYVISAIAGVQGSLYLMVLSINSIVFVARGHADPPGEVPIWSSLAAATSAATLLLLAHAGRRMEV